MSGPKRRNPGDKTLGLDQPIDRRDFLNSTLLASGGLLLTQLAPVELMAQGGDWTGYGGVGDYRNSNGNTEAVMNAAHKIRDHIFDAPPPNVIDTGETFDCVVVGGGLSGLAAALFFNREAGPRLKCLVLENHPVFGGEAKRNEFTVDGQRLFAQQGSTHFQIPYPHSYLERFYQSIGMDYRQFKYQTWGSSEREIPLSRSPYQMLSIEPSTYGFYFGAKFGQQPGLWLIDPWGRKLEGAPLSTQTRAELLKSNEGADPSAWPPKLPFDYPGDDISPLRQQNPGTGDDGRGRAESGDDTHVLQSGCGGRLWPGTGRAVRLLQVRLGRLLCSRRYAHHRLADVPRRQRRNGPPHGEDAHSGLHLRGAHARERLPELHQLCGS